MTRMKFRDFYFPHNPRKIQVLSRRLTAEHQSPGGGSQVQSLGSLCRVVTGEGELTGPQAPALYARLEELLAAGEAGTLSVPMVVPFSAYLTSLELVGEGDGQSLHYRFAFTEARREKGGTARGTGAPLGN